MEGEGKSMNHGSIDSDVARLWDRFGWKGFLRLVFYPLSVLIMAPLRLFDALFSLRTLRQGRWRHCLQFNPFSGLGNYFYWTAAINLRRYGRSGTSPCLGTGSYPMDRFFYYSSPSLFAYWKLGALAVLAGMFGWWGAHLIWLAHQDGAWVALVMALALFSTTFYANTFGLQNYNSLGWMFFPLGLFGMLTNNAWVAGAAWFAASFGSLTVVIVAAFLSAAWAIEGSDAARLLPVFPAILKLSAHVFPLLRQGSFQTTVANIAKAIGLKDHRTKYRRTSTKSFGAGRLFYLLLCMQFLVSVHILFPDGAPLVAAGIGLFLLNSVLFRFADEQSMHMMMLSLGAATVLQVREPMLVVSFWLLASPPARVACFPSSPQVWEIVPRVRPFITGALIEKLEEFFSPVGPGQRVWMAFCSPGGVYEKVFDGYRALLEPALYVASSRSFHLMPDWWGIWQLNEENSPELWGRDESSVKQNMDFWKADFLVVYQDAGEPLVGSWGREGFDVLGQFSWKEWEVAFGDARPYTGNTPDWWLLRRRESAS